MKVAFIIFFLLLYGVGYAEEDLRELQNKRQQIIKTIKKYQKELSNIKKQKKALKKSKCELTHRYTKYKEKISQLCKQERLLREKIVEVVRMCYEIHSQLLSIKDKLKTTSYYLHRFLLPSTEILFVGQSNVLHLRYLLKETLWLGYARVCTLQAQKVLYETKKSQLDTKHANISLLRDDTEKKLVLVSHQLNITEQKRKNLDLTYAQIKKRITELLSTQKRLDILISKLRQEFKPTQKISLPQNLRLPIHNAKLIKGFGSYKHPEYNIYLQNKGIDLQVRDDKVVKAVDDGEVVYADVFEGYGKLVIINHRNRVCSLYSGLENITTAVGKHVKSGEKIGIAGDILHFELRVDGKAVNPVAYLAK